MVSLTDLPDDGFDDDVLESVVGLHARHALEQDADLLLVVPARRTASNKAAQLASQQRANEVSLQSVSNVDEEGRKSH